MKNKRWKREAKRIKGKCLSCEDCFECNLDNECGRVGLATGLAPYVVGIRDLERIHKKYNKKNIL